MAAVVRRAPLAYLVSVDRPPIPAEEVQSESGDVLFAAEGAPMEAVGS